MRDLLNEIQKVDESKNVCKNYRQDTGTCRTGCPKAKVAKEAACPFYAVGDRGNYPDNYAGAAFEDQCPCFKR